MKIHCCAAGPKPLEYEWLFNDQVSSKLKSFNSVLAINGAKVKGCSNLLLRYIVWCTTKLWLYERAKLSVDTKSTCMMMLSTCVLCLQHCANGQPDFILRFAAHQQNVGAACAVSELLILCSRTCAYG